MPALLEVDGLTIDARADDGSLVPNVPIHSLAELYGDNGSIGDVCAPLYGPFFRSAVDVIESACNDIPERR